MSSQGNLNGKKTGSKERLFASSLLAGVAAMGVPMLAGVATLSLAPEAQAQDYTSGVITGSVEDESGAPVAGATVTITSRAQGFSRTATTSSSGAYRFAGLPGGQYSISVAGETQTVRVNAGETVSFSFVTSGSSDEIVVTGTRAVQAFANTTTGLNLNVEELVRDVPVARNLTALITLAPGTSTGDAAFGNLASIGGSSVAENAYYINGLNITDFDTYLGSALVPFEFYRYVETKSGGYPAEFGRATGGIVNAVTRSGSNEFRGALHVTWSPDELSEDGDDLQNCQFSPALTCSNLTLRSEDVAESYSTVLEMGGPLIRDRLFAYGLLELRNVETSTNNLIGGTRTTDVSDNPFWGVKLDAYPLDDHHFEFTYFDTRRTTVRTINAISYTGGNYVVGTKTGENEFNLGGYNYVGQYTGHITDWLTVSAAVGQYNNRFDNAIISPADTFFRNLSGVTAFGVANGGYYNPQRTATVETPYDTRRDFWRADIDVFFTLFGDHHIRAGVDNEDNTLEHNSVRFGPDESIYIMRRCSTTNSLRCNGTPDLNAGDLYVEVNHFNSGGSFEGENAAMYIQDEWRPTDRLTLNLGGRWDTFKVFQGSGQEMVNLEDNFGLRTGFSYDLDEEGRTQLFGSFSQYYLPIASNTAFRMTGFEEFWREYWTITGVSGGQPALGSQITGWSGAAPCPAPLLSGSAPAGTVACSVTGDGSAKSSETLISQNLEATQEDEWIIGLRHQFNDRWSFGVSLTHRELVTTAEDAAIDAAVLNYCAANSIANCSSTWTGFHQYVIINPGNSATVTLDGLSGQTVTFTAAELGYDAAERTYDAVEFTFRRDRQEGDRWDIAGSYTLSESRGNSEGYVQSDFGQDDAGITQDFDQPGFLDGADGLLPNHRRHRVKLWGSYDVTEAFSVGSQVQISSPRPLSCFGLHPTDPFANAYGAASHFCGGVLSPRGTASETDWIYNVDLSFRYTIDVASGLTLRADIFNLFNFQGANERSEFGDLASGGPDPNYDIITAYQSPRSVRIGFDLEF